jgi:ABC-type polysaccharide/polyol phosphate transport system ATPase subunit
MAVANLTATPAIVVRGVSKTFQIPEDARYTLKERALHPRHKTRKREFNALKGVSFAVDQGEFFGIVGRNGSGKSTLLKCIAGIYHADGEIYRRGRMSTMIERFRELKVKNYSSGMIIRLAFSVAIQVDADLLLVDEILAVGDASFQQKCFDVFYRMRDEGKTIVFVTHDMGSMTRFCHRAMLLSDGEMLHIGEPQEIADRYLELNFGRAPSAATEGEPDERSGDGEARVVEVWIEDLAGTRLASVPHGERVRLRARVAFNVDVRDPAASVYILNEEHKAVTIASTVGQLDQTGHFAAGEEAVFTFAFDNVLAPGRYSPLVNLAHGGTGLDVMDRFDSGFTFVVTATRTYGGVVDLPVEVGIERAGERVSA